MEQSIKNSVGYAADPRVQNSSPLQNALNNNGEQLDKLYSLVDELAGRLSPIRSDQPVPEEAGRETEPSAPSSPLVYQVRAQAEVIRTIQRRVSDIIADIEV